MTHLPSIRHAFNRFDVIVLSVLIALGIATGLITLRGDRVGVHVIEFTPAPNSTGISTRSEIGLTFGELMDEASVERRFQVMPPLDGEMQWRGKTMIWRSRSGLAIDTAYVVTLTAGASSVQDHTLKDDLIWTFHTGRPQVLYMNVGDVSQLYSVDTLGLSSRQLTNLDDRSSVWDYAVSADGNQIAFGVVRPDASAVDLWLMNADGSDARRLLACDNSQCTGVTWSPDGRRLAYERRELNADLGAVGMGLGPSRIWLLDPRSGLTKRLFEDSQELGYAPRWSPDGSHLGYFDPRGGVRILEMDTGASQLIPNQLGEIGTWSPDGKALVMVDLLFSGESYSSFLLQAKLTDGTTNNLSGAETEINDGSPAWSPSGEWIAFGRKSLADGTPTPGQQLWLMRPDGSEPHPLVIDPDAHLGSIAWSPDGRAIAYLRFQLMQADAHPEIWLVTVDRGDAVKLAHNGTLPGWLP